MKRKLIILEGADCTGKSTLLNKIKNEDTLVIHNGVYESRTVAFETYIDQIADNIYKSVILDRSYISELIYGSIYRGEKNHEWKSEIRLLESMMVSYFSPLVIVCLPPIEIVLNEWQNRINTEYIKDSYTIEAIYAEYQLNIGNYTSLPVVPFNYAQPEQSYINLMKGLLR